VLGGLDEAREHGERRHEEDERPRRAHVLDVERTEPHAGAARARYPEQARAAYPPRVESVLADCPQRADARDDGVEALVENQPENEGSA
jgi:hypothetical protein